MHLKSTCALWYLFTWLVCTASNCGDSNKPAEQCPEVPANNQNQPDSTFATNDNGVDHSTSKMVSNKLPKSILKKRLQQKQKPLHVARDSSKLGHISLTETKDPA